MSMNINNYGLKDKRDAYLSQIRKEYRDEKISKVRQRILIKKDNSDKKNEQTHSEIDVRNDREDPTNQFENCSDYDNITSKSFDF